MKSKRIIPIFFILILSIFPTIPFVGSAGYGEENENLGQFTDDFENDDNVSVAVNVINNQTLDCMELNYTLDTGWMNNSWAYRKNHTIENATGANTNYQVNITVHYGAGVDNDNDVYLNSLSQTDFDDIRFTRSDGITELNYTMLEKVDSSQALFYIKILDNLSVDDQLIYIYYNESSVTTTSNGDNTFPFFDHFPGVNLDLTKWAGDTGSATVAGSKVTLRGVDAWKRIYGTTEYTIPFSVTIKAQLEGGYRNILGVRDTATVDICDIAFGSVVGVSQVRTFKAGASTTAGSNVATTEKVFIITMTKTEVSYYSNGVELVGSPIGTNIPIVDMPISLWAWESDGTKDLIADYAFIQEFVDPEPSHGSWGAQETISSVYASEGYFTTEDYLNYTTGQGLALITNASIPVGTSMTVQFSDDNATWVDNEGNVGSTSILDGFYAIDLRDLNYTDSFKMYNLTTTDDQITPRIFQSRLVTTNGTAGAGPGPIIIQNVTGEWFYYNLTTINVTVGVHDTGDLNSTLDIDGDTYNCSEIVGVPGYVIEFEWTDVDQDAHCLWVTAYIFYDGVSAHTINVDLWNFTSTAWVTIGIIYDMVDFEWVNSSIYDLRMPNDFINSTGAVRGRFYHSSAGNINDDIHTDFLKLYAFIPSDAITPIISEENFFWVFIAIVLSIITALLVWMKYEHSNN